MKENALTPALITRSAAKDTNDRFCAEVSTANKRLFKVSDLSGKVIFLQSVPHPIEQIKFHPKNKKFLFISGETQKGRQFLSVWDIGARREKIYLEYDELTNARLDKGLSTNTQVDLSVSFEVFLSPEEDKSNLLTLVRK